MVEVSTMGHKISVVQCCQEEQIIPRWNSEDLDFAREEGPIIGEDVAVVHPFYCEPARNGCHPDIDAPVSLACMRCKPRNGSPSRAGCCSTATGSDDHLASSPSPLESLSYTPVRFDEGSTIDHERSHARYSKIVVHSTRARTQKRSKVWEDWLRAATEGCAITLLNGIAEDLEDDILTLKKVPATYQLDERALSKLSILPANSDDLSSAITILIDSIQVICPATDFMLFFEQVGSKLDESEKNRAVLLQYVTEDTERRRVCFLEESEPAKERFVQALTALWLEKRNDHSMWF